MLQGTHRLSAKYIGSEDQEESKHLLEEANGVAVMDERKHHKLYSSPITDHDLFYFLKVSLKHPSFCICIIDL